MDIPHQLITHLAELSAALDEDGTDLQAMLEVLTDDLAAAVPSILGLTMTIPHGQNDEHGFDGDRVTLNFLPPGLVGSVSTSMLLPLDALGVTGPGGTVVFFAARPGAFVDLAADTSFAYNLDGHVRLDEHLPSADCHAGPPGVSGHTELSTINQAIGALLDRGHTTTEARSILRRLADQDGIPLHHAAEQLLNNPG